MSVGEAAAKATVDGGQQHLDTSYESTMRAL
jgi:hypothetical protein